MAPPISLLETSQGSELMIEESRHNVGSLEQLEMHADKHYLAGKLSLEDHLGKVPGGLTIIINKTLTSQDSTTYHN